MAAQQQNQIFKTEKERKIEVQTYQACESTLIISNGRDKDLPCRVQSTDSVSSFFRVHLQWIRCLCSSCDSEYFSLLAIQFLYVSVRVQTVCINKERTLSWNNCSACNFKRHVLNLF